MHFLIKNLRKFLILFILLVGSSFSAFCVSRGGQDLILPGSWVYDALLSIEMEMARVTFSDQAPISISELKCYLDDVDYERLSEPGKKQYNRLEAYILEKNWSWNFGLFSIGTEISVNPEFYYKTNPEISWVYDYTKQQALLDLPLKFGIGDYLTVYMGLSCSQNYTAKFSHENHINHFFSLETFDPILVHENYLSGGYMWENGVGFNIRLGSGTQSLGNTLMPSILLSEYLTDAPFANLRFFSPIFQYDFNVTQLSRASYFYSHKIQFRFFKKIQLSFIEGVLPYNAFDLRFVNPFGIFHDYTLFKEHAGRVNSFFGAKFSFSPCKYLRIYGLYAQNEHNLPMEHDATPEGNGFQIGGETYVPLKKGYFHAGIEFYHTLPYLFIKETPNISFAKVFSEMVDNAGTYYQWMGNPLGPDSIAFQVALGYEMPEVFSVDVAYSFAAKGEFSGTSIFENSKWSKNDFSFNEANWIYPTDTIHPNGYKYKTPTGLPEYENKISVKGTLSPLSWMTIVLQPSYTVIVNANYEAGKVKHGFEIICSTRINLTKMSHNCPSVDFLFTDGK